MIIICIRHNFKTRRSRNASTDWRSCSIFIIAASDTAGSKLGAYNRLWFSSCVRDMILVVAVEGFVDAI